MSRGSRVLFATLCTFISVLIAFALYQYLDPQLKPFAYGSAYCRSIKYCSEPGFKGQELWQDAWTEGNEETDHWLNASRSQREIPQYVFEYAPLVHLYSGEQFWPGDIADHLFHVTPNLNYTPIRAESQNTNLTNLDDLNEYGRFVYLKSDDDVEERPEWLGGKKNIPSMPDNEDSPRRWAGKQKNFGYGKGVANGKEETRKQLGRSNAPAVLIVVDKGHGIVDAFWFFFYSYNLGNVVLNVRFGNHVGDWEHSLVRFQHGKPKAVFFSEHNFGSAYSYGAVEKLGKRPVIYSATGSHAMYATSGAHPYVLPLGLLHDQTDHGPLWDPSLNSHTYTYDYVSDTLHASNATPQAPTEWFYFAGRWGDKFYPIEDERQYELAGQYHYVSGPLGPRFKNLGRRKICQGRYSDPCVIKNWLEGEVLKEWRGVGTGEDEEWDGDEFESRSNSEEPVES